MKRVFDFFFSVQFSTNILTYALEQNMSVFLYACVSQDKIGW